MSEATWQRTADAVRAAFDTGDLTGLAPLLAPDMRWPGAGPRGCGSAADVLARIDGATAAGGRFRPAGLRRTGVRERLRAAGAVPSEIADGSSDDVTADEFRRITEVTYLGFGNGTRTALRHMRPPDRGVIIQVGSALAYRGIPLQAAYCSAKHAARSRALRASQPASGSRQDRARTGTAARSPHGPGRRLAPDVRPRAARPRSRPPPGYRW